MKNQELVIAMVLSLVETTGRAQPAGAQAEVLFRQGQGLLADGKITEACAAFDASQRLDPTVATSLNQANCREKNNQLATAWGLFLEAERKTSSGNDPATKQLHQVAIDHAAKLETRLSTLTISVNDDARIGGLEILRDTDVIDVGTWNKTLPIDGGTYKITARAPGNAEWVTTVTIANERDAKAIEIPKLKAPDLRASLTTVPVTAAPSETSAPIQPTQHPHGSKRIPLLIAGAGVVALAGGLLLEFKGESTFDEAKVEHDTNKQLALWHSANAERYTAEALAVAGIGAGAVAVWLYLRD